MTFIEFLGTVVTVAALIFLVLRHFFAMMQERLNPEEYAKQQKQKDDNLRRLLKAKGGALGGEERAPSKKVQQKPQPIQVKSPSKPLFDYDTKPAERYEVLRIEKPSTGRQLIKGLKSPRDMIILKEILDKPLSMRD